MEVGQLILVKKILRIGGKLQEYKKSIRPAIVREVVGENIINVRLVSTIYVNQNVTPKSFEEASQAIANNLKGVLPHEKQYVILSPEDDGVLNFSYVYGNMYTDTIDLNAVECVELLDDKTGKPIIISERAKIEIEEKEIDAIIENIIKQYKIEFKKNIKKGIDVEIEC